MRLEKNDTKLYVWGEDWYDKVKRKKGVPWSIDVMIKDEPNKYPGEWTMYEPSLDGYPPTGENIFPQKAYLEIPANYKIAFDFLEWSHRVKIVSEGMLEFLQYHNIVEGYEIAVLDVISKKGKKIDVEKEYFALRFNLFDDEILGFNYKDKSVLISKMCGEKENEKQIFISNHITYRSALIFTEKIKKSIEEKGFIGPGIYPIEKYKKEGNIYKRNSLGFN